MESFSFYTHIAAIGMTPDPARDTRLHLLYTTVHLKNGTVTKSPVIFFKKVM